ncbi:MAG TPA: RNA 2',3'-cyclic phosphodiesterase [Candidatus Syntrophoarchaeum butanivorans]|uniref:RNA 2',3'-cyclic phosphodiesterase n=1 Tax=Candidatus Syntropharchaeum butanivorans TaxID=1839936 RepID=A0A7C0X2M6_9EURY|nr:RNA 2',3'-cyclic phosphodiesterase [Candidatus Syntrophoarchaeum butanivorans]
MMRDEIRAFIAVDIPETTRSKISALQREMYIEGVKLVDPSLIHVTLKFLGDTPVKKIEDVIRVLETIDVSSFKVNVRGMGAFPDLTNPRVVWIGLEPASEFMRIHEKLENTLSSLGFSRERRSFTPHLTIARVKRAGKNERSLIAEFVRKNAEIDLDRILVSEIKLKKSILRPEGPIYTDIFVKKLR